MRHEPDWLILRNIEAKDAEPLLADLQAPVVSCFLLLTLSDPAAVPDHMSQITEDSLIAALKDSDLLFGDLLSNREDDTVSVGWTFQSAHGGEGYAPGAAQALFAHPFGVEGVRRICAFI